MRLLPREALFKTGPVDHADWNYKPLLGTIQRLRFKLALDLIREQRYGRMLEIGYGSGVFMPELAQYCGELYGVDVHDHTEAVRQRLEQNQVKATLCTSGAESLPFDNEFFDCVVAVSSLEFVTDLEKVCAEANRVLTPSGRLIVITPGSSPLLDFGLKILTGKSAKSDFGDRRSKILPTLERFFTFSSKRKLAGGLYQALDCRARLEMRPSTVIPSSEAFDEESMAAENYGRPPVVVFPINQAPARRGSARPVPVPVPVIPPGEPLIGDLNHSTNEELARAILAVRRRRHTANAAQLSEQQQHKHKESA